MKILLCIDDDAIFPDVLRALEKFVDASRWNEVVTLHVVAPSLFPAVGEPPLRRGEALLARALSRLSSLPAGVEVALSNGDPTQEIIRTADECEADLIILGALGERRDFLIGSVSQKVVSLAATDVLVVRECAAATKKKGSRRAGTFRALVAVDGSLGSEAGMDSFARKMRARNATIRLIHVVERVPSLWEGAKDPPALDAALGRRAQEVLARAKESLESRGLEVECEWRWGSPAAQILDAARELETDLIVVGSRGHSAIREMVLGSITHRVLRHAPCTVFCARGWAFESRGLSRAWTADSWEPQAGMA